MSNVHTCVDRYIREGWSPIPIPAREKGPRGDEWQKKVHDYALTDFDDDSNIGVHLGELIGAGPERLYDVDLDDKAAAIAADILLPNTDRISGRPGKPRSHRFYACVEPIPHIAYHGLGGSNDTIVELRGTSKGGSPTQTVVPPSLHPSGETIGWVNEGKPFVFDKAVPFIAAVRNVAIATLVARHFPGPGHRHDPRMALAGFLCRAGVTEPEVLAIGKAAMRIIGGNQTDWHDAAKSTFAKIANGESTMGGPKLAEFLGDHGPGVLKTLNKWLGRTEEAFLEEMIDKLNDRHMILRVASKMVVADFSNEAAITLMQFDDFRKLYCKDFMPDQKREDGSVKKKGRAIADVWIEHPRGRKQKDLIYAPPGSDIELKPDDYNGWKGFRVEPKQGDWSLINQHLTDVICGGDMAVYTWVINWVADLLQRPGHVPGSAIVMKGGQGTGKGFVADDLLGQLFHPRHYVHIVERDQFYGNFTETLSGRSLVFLDEATWGGANQERGILKGRVTNRTMIVNRKHIPAVEERSMLHIIIASNEDWPIGVDRDDRRFCCLNVVNPHANAPAYFKPLYTQLHDGGRAAFLYDMLEWHVDEDLLRQPPTTQGKDDLKAESSKPVEDWWLERLKDGTLIAGRGWARSVVKRELHAAYRSETQALGHRPLSDNRFAAALLKMCSGLQNGPRPHGGQRSWLIPSLQECRDQFVEYARRTIDWDD